MIHNVDMHHRLVLACGATGRRTRDQPSHELDLLQGIAVNPQFSIFTYLTNFKPTFGLPPEIYISNGFAFIKDIDGPTEIAITEDKYSCLDGYDDVTPFNHQVPSGQALAALMYWLDQLNDWHEWGLTPLWKFYQVSDQTSTPHIYTLNDTIFVGENWTHVDILQQIRNRITEISRILGFTDGSRFYLGQVGYTYATQGSLSDYLSNDATLDTRWLTQRDEIGEYGKFKLAEYTEVFPGLVWGGARKSKTNAGIPSHPDPFKVVDLDSPALHRGFAVTPGDSLSIMEATGGTGFSTTPGFDPIDIDYTNLVETYPQTTNGSGSLSDQISVLSGRLDLSYSYLSGTDFSTQNGALRLTRYVNSGLNCAYLGGKNLLHRYGYKQATPTVYCYLGKYIQTVLLPSNTWTPSQVFNTLKFNWKYVLYKSDYTQFPKTGISGNRIYHEFYHSFQDGETLAEYEIDALATPNINGGLLNPSDPFSGYYPEFSDTTIDLTPLWAVEGKQWVGVRTECTITYDFNDPETLVVPGPGTSQRYNHSAECSITLSARTVDAHEYYLPFFSGAFGQPVNPVYAPYNIRGLYPNGASDTFIRNSLWTS